MYELVYFQTIILIMFYLLYLQSLPHAYSESITHIDNNNRLKLSSM